MSPPTIACSSHSPRPLTRRLPPLALRPPSLTFSPSSLPHSSQFDAKALILVSNLGLAYIAHYNAPTFYRSLAEPSTVRATPQGPNSSATALEEAA